MSKHTSTFREEFEEEFGFRWKPWRWLIAAIGVVLIIVLIAYVIGWITQPARTAAGVRERVGNADNALFQYEKFHDACAAIVASDKQYQTAKTAAESHDKRMQGKPDPLGRNADESSRLHQVADGFLYTRQKAAEQYNADSRKWTQDLFKSKSLPYRIGDATPDCDA
ncbi:hypothetical protein GCM10009733_020630 [Nonomuraea maheshkhaliensis]|uniref:LemA family protein n=1 Tax=Nonomuraea maheshkhaliensis TaxID=419590 RepID=A0ABN2F298_9ACTN